MTASLKLDMDEILFCNHLFSNYWPGILGERGSQCVSGTLRKAPSKSIEYTIDLPYIHIQYTQYTYTLFTFQLVEYGLLPSFSLIALLLGVFVRRSSVISELPIKLCFVPFIN